MVLTKLDQLAIRRMYSSSIPTSGTYQKGDIIWNTSPTSNSYVGWVCITGGTPGIWKGFGLIEA